MIRAKASDAVSTGEAAMVTLQSLSNQSYRLEQVVWSYSGDNPIVGNLLISDENEATLLSINITNTGPGFLPLAGLNCSGAVCTVRGVTDTDATVSLLYSLTGDMLG